MVPVLPLSSPSCTQALNPRSVTLSLAACAAIAVPTLIAPNLPPTATFFNQALALLGWGALLALIATTLSARRGPWPTGLKALAVAMLLLLVTTLVSPWWTSLPGSLALSTAGMIAAAMLAAIGGATLEQAACRTQAFRALCVGMLVAASANASIAVAQVYAAPWIDGFWIASVADGRAAGNLRQANQLCTVLLWGIIATLWLGETRTLRQLAVEPVGLLLMFGVVLSGSRTGIVGVLVVALWGLLDRSLSRRARASLLLAPLAYALLWAGAAAWAHFNEQVFGGAARYAAAGALTTSRWDLWANMIALIRDLPWLGVGPGELNLAWSLTEFSVRSGEFFDHAHNLPLQFAVELGLPLAGAVLVLLGWALFFAARNSSLPVTPLDSVPPQRAAFVMLLLVLVHSLLEYPLWYAYFLLPAAFALGICLGGPSRQEHAPTASSPATRQVASLRVASIALMLGAAYLIYDYFKVVVIFAPGENAAPLAERIAEGQRSVFFSHHADYAAATTSDDPAQALAAAQRAAHYLLDTRLMMAWANALHATGDSERAKYVAQRLKEFRDAQSVAYFAPCSDLNLSDTDKPYQCFAPQRKFTFKDFR